jgi:hypothetical protein
VVTSRSGCTKSISTRTARRTPAVLSFCFLCKESQQRNFQSPVTRVTRAPTAQLSRRAGRVQGRKSVLPELASPRVQGSRAAQLHLKLSAQCRSLRLGHHLPILLVASPIEGTRKGMTKSPSKARKASRLLRSTPLLNNFSLRFAAARWPRSPPRAQRR